MDKRELAKHVKNSFWLDLAYDEENKGLLIDKNLIDEKELKKLEKDGSRRSIPPLPTENENDPSFWFDHFRRMKAVRVLDGLDLNAKSRDYANSVSNSAEGQFQQNEFESLRKRAKSQNNNLEKITWKCCAAIDKILEYYGGVPESEENHRSEWATLLALYHSELCASSSPEISFGWARREAYVLKKEAVGLKIFRWIAKNNVSRGYNHLKNPLSAVKRLDYDIDTFKCNELAKTLGDKSAKKIQENENMLYRLLYAPAILTLAQGLCDLRRHSERRFYLKEGARTISRIGATYWREVIELQLLLAVTDTGLEPEKLNTYSGLKLSPRTEQLSRMEQIQRAELKIRNHFRHRGVLGVESIDEMLENWLTGARWLHYWDSSETKAFLAGLQTTAVFLAHLLKLVKKGTKNSAAEERLYERKVVEVSVKYLIEIHSYMKFLTDGGIFSAENEPIFSVKQIAGLKYLLGVKSVNKNNRQHLDFYEIWKTGSPLIECIRRLIDISKNLGNSYYGEIETLKLWGKKLEKALNWLKPGSDSYQRQFRSEIGHLKLFPYTTPEDRFCKQSESNCQDSCFRRITDNVESDAVAHFQTYKRAMRSQQERFLDYLKFRTGRNKNYRVGEPLNETPNFELISLRRWNSFSPNLGSRAAASVGGGYLIRLWRESRKSNGSRYIGIAVDPGYNFLENLFNEGFTIADIDIVVVTHAHPDHTENLTNLFTLLFERNKRMADETEQDEISSPIDHSIFLLLTEGVFERYQSLLLSETKGYVRDVVVLKARDWPGSEASSATVKVMLCDDNPDIPCHIELSDKTERNGKGDECIALIQAKRAWHDDQTEHDSIGIVVTYFEKDKQSKIGVLGDSKYHKDLYIDYGDCSVLIAHIGSVMSKPYNDDIDCVKTMQNEAHLYLPGLTRLICDLKNRNGNNKFPLMVISEFGEELRGGLRKDLAVRLASGVQTDNKLPIVPADVGLRIDIDNQEVFCSVCHHYCDWSQIYAESVLPHEEALAFVCKDCQLLRGRELNKLLEEWCTTGRPVSRIKGSTEPR